MPYNEAVELAKKVKVAKLDSTQWIAAHRDAYEYATNTRVTGWWIVGLGLTREEV